MTIFSNIGYISLSQNWKSKLDALTLEHSIACEEVNRLQTELATLKKEQGDLLCKIKEQEPGSCLSDDLQILVKSFYLCFT